MKNMAVSVRFSAEEIEKIDKIANALRVTRSDFLRKAALEARDDSLRSDIEDIKNSIKSLVVLLEEHVRIPTFREFRVRVGVEKLLQIDENTKLDDFLLAAARMYYARFGVWPTPEDAEKFGSLPKNPWPKTPV